MLQPEISVVIPAYNCGNYLVAAIDSILQQSFTNIECVVINDGSTDNTEAIILSYTDPRMVYLKNPHNKGLVYTLNRGLAAAKGNYIARMDGDDIAHPDRLLKQLAYLTTHPKVHVLATQVELIDEAGHAAGTWLADKHHITARDIAAYLPVDNCIAHPTVMASTKLLLQYQYKPSQKLAEDYDLWLRLAADGRVIAKLPEPLLQHRILQTSFTRTRKLNVYYKLSAVKWQFVKEQFAAGKLNGFTLKTLFYCLLNRLMGAGKQLFRFFKLT